MIAREVCQVVAAERERIRIRMGNGHGSADDPALAATLDAFLSGDMLTPQQREAITDILHLVDAIASGTYVFDEVVWKGTLPASRDRWRADAVALRALLAPVIAREENDLTGVAGLRVLCADIRAIEHAKYGSGLFDGTVPTWEVLKFLDGTSTVGQARERRRLIGAKVDRMMADAKAGRAPH